MHALYKSSYTRFLGIAVTFVVLLLLTVFVVASVSAYTGTTARLVAESEARALTFAQILTQDAPTSHLLQPSDPLSASSVHIREVLRDDLNKTAYGQYVGVFFLDRADSATLSAYRSGVTGTHRKESGVYNDIKRIYTQDMLDTTVFLGRGRGVTGDTVTSVVFFTLPNSESVALVLEEDARPFAQAVLSATLFPFVLLVLLYALGVVIWFWIRMRVRALQREQEYLTLTARDMYTPLVGIGWAIHELQTKKRHKGITRAQLFNELTEGQHMLLMWVKHMLERPRQIRALLPVNLTKGDENFTEILNWVVGVHDLYARARGIKVSIDRAFPEVVPITVDRTAVTRALIQLVGYVLGETVAGDIVAFKFDSDDTNYIIECTGLPLVTKTPRALLFAEHELRTQGIMLTIEEQETGIALILTIPHA